MSITTAPALAAALLVVAMTPGIGAAQIQMPTPAPAAGTATTATLLGEVRLIDREANKVTVAHEPIAEFNMRAMTMVLQAPNPALIEGLAIGDKIRAQVARVGGAFAIQALEVVK